MSNNEELNAFLFTRQYSYYVGLDSSQIFEIMKNILEGRVIICGGYIVFQNYFREYWRRKKSSEDLS